MYYRIKNRLDFECVVNNLRDIGVIESCVAERIGEIVSILDEAYGECRDSHAMGGYIFLFPDRSSYDKNYKKIIDFHRLDEELFEYSDVLLIDGEQEWREELFLLSSDESLVLIHPVIVTEGNK